MKKYENSIKISDKTKIEQEASVERLAKKLKKIGITKFQISSLGNSISNGYSTTRLSKPLLERIEGLESKFDEIGVAVEKNNFSRPQNNDDSKIYSWLKNNVSQKEINEMNRIDYIEPESNLETTNLTLEQIYKYYPIEPESNRKIQEVFFETEKSVANIVIYNGGTGHLLNQMLRGGSIKNILDITDLRDTHNLFGILKTIYDNNKNNGSRTQVLVCGMPNLLGLKITDILNHKMKKVSKYFPNVTYVNPQFCKYLVYNYNNKKYVLDPHYNPEEYTRFTTKIMNTLTENFVNKQSLMELDIFLSTFSKLIEFNRGSYTEEQITSTIINFVKSLKWEKTKNFDKEICKYILDNFPDDYYHTGKNNINKVITIIKEKVK